MRVLEFNVGVDHSIPALRVYFKNFDFATQSKCQNQNILTALFRKLLNVNSRDFHEGKKCRNHF